MTSLCLLFFESFKQNRTVTDDIKSFVLPLNYKGKFSFLKPNVMSCNVYQPPIQKDRQPINTKGLEKNEKEVVQLSD